MDTIVRAYHLVEYSSASNFNSDQMDRISRGWTVHTMQFVPGSGLPFKILWSRETALV